MIEPTSFQPEAVLRFNLAQATSGLDLSAQEERILDWLAGWDQDVVGPIVTLLRKARESTERHA